ncbi:hypothetical protein [Chitinophaga sp.]|uniref:hypothetical protein n=1 Tax=Chitinophaga sp. TaxID=1869181 RepID=UPI0031E08302
METHEQKKRRLYGKRYFKEYNSILEKLQKNGDPKRDLLSIAETDDFIAKSPDFSLLISKKLLFPDKEGLKSLITDNVKCQDQPFYLLNALSRDCGALKLSSLHDFNLDFHFYDDSSGIITLTAVSYKEKILLDFYIENDVQYLEVELYRGDGV